MTEGPALDAATRRLAQALEALEAAAERRQDADRDSAGLGQQLQAIGLDRARLASDLDAQAVRVRQLEEANRAATQRIDAAMESIQSVLDADTDSHVKP